MKILICGDSGTNPPWIPKDNGTPTIPGPLNLHQQKVVWKAGLPSRRICVKNDQLNFRWTFGGVCTRTNQRGGNRGSWALNDNECWMRTFFPEPSTRNILQPRKVLHFQIRSTHYLYLAAFDHGQKLMTAVVFILPFFKVGDFFVIPCVLRCVKS